MKKLFPILLGCFAFALVSCGGDDCQTCKGDLLSTPVDMTICDNGDGTVTSTNNETGEVETDSISFDSFIADTEAIGLQCN